MIQVFKPSYDEEEFQAVRKVLESGWVGLGPKTAEFEREFAKFCQVKYCVGMNSCTAALDMALKLLGINHGDEVIVPTMTFVSTAHCVVYNLATPIFVDIDHNTLNISPDKIEEHIEKTMAENRDFRIKAIIPVHVFGQPCEMNKILKSYLKKYYL